MSQGSTKERKENCVWDFELSASAICTFTMPDSTTKCTGPGCFVAGTLVATSAGWRPIESIRPGDWVLSGNPADGSQSYKQVLSTSVRPAAQVIRIRYRAVSRGREGRSRASKSTASSGESADGAGARSESAECADTELAVTFEHPFWNVNRNGWLEREQSKHQNAQVKECVLCKYSVS